MAEWLSGWAKRIKITVDSSKVDAALSNFPVPIKISTSSGLTSSDVSAYFDELSSDANRKKIAVTTSDGITQCQVEIERHDDANEKAWLHVNLPSISDSVDTDLYLYYDSTHADNSTYVGDTTDAAAQAVWDSNFIAVWNMADATTSTIKNSKTDAHHGTKYAANNPLQADGQFGLAQEFFGNNEGNSDITIPDHDDFDLQADFTIESLIYCYAFGDAGDNNNYECKILAKDNGTARHWSYFIRGEADATNVGKQKFLSKITVPESAVLSSSAIALNTWTHTAFTFNNSGPAYVFYKNGAADGSGATDRTPTTTGTAPLYIGGGPTPDLYVHDWYGKICAVRISNTARSAAWLKATYHGLFDSLLTFSGEEILGEITDAAALGDTLDALHLAEILTDGVALGDELDGYYLREAITDGVGLGDTFDPLHLVETITDGAGLGDALAREIEAALSIADGAGLGDEILAHDLRAEITDAAALNDTITRTAEYYPVLTDALGAGDSFFCLNWSEWLRLNSGQALKRFYFTLTGDGETPAVADAVIPISSFQARLRQGEPTYLSVVIPDLDTYSAIVSARSNGQMVIDMALILDGVEAVREEICRVDLEDINIYEGARNKSITLSGHATETYTTKITALTGASYYNLSGGLRRYRCAMDPYLKPGDTVRVNSEEFEVGYITISRSVGSETMEVVEAES